MGLLDDYTFGVGSPRPRKQHQRVMAKMFIQSFYELSDQGLEILTEQTITDDCRDLAPDLVVFDREGYPLTIVEITTHKELRSIIRKCYELIARFPNSEYFVYDYEEKVLFMYDAESDHWLSSEEYELYSQYLSKPIMNYINQ